MVLCSKDPSATILYGPHHFPHFVDVSLVFAGSVFDTSFFIDISFTSLVVPLVGSIFMVRDIFLVFPVKTMFLC
jgi:hypothetical protein